MRLPSARSFLAPRPQYGLAILLLVVGVVPVRAEEPVSADGPVPRIEVESYEVDLGTVDRGDLVEARFAIRNVGGRELRILKVKPG